jgi:hypothetical protein
LSLTKKYAYLYIGFLDQTLGTGGGGRGIKHLDAIVNLDD